MVGSGGGAGGGAGGGIPTLWDLVKDQVENHTAVSFVRAVLKRHREDAASDGGGPGGAADAIGEFGAGAAGAGAGAASGVGAASAAAPPVPSLQLTVDVSAFAIQGLRSPSTSSNAWVSYVLATAMSKAGEEKLAKWMQEKR